MPQYPFRPGMQPRPALPAAFYKMTRDEIVKFYTDRGYSQKATEREADGFEEYRSRMRGEDPSESVRKGSVSENGVWDRLIKALRRRDS